MRRPPIGAAVRRTAPPSDPAGIPLTRRQALIWVEHELAPSTPRNIMVARFEVAAPIDAARFADAFAALVEETEALRTIVVRTEADPVQHVQAQIVHRTPLVDLSGEADPDAALERFLVLHAPEPMRLDRRLFDCWLVRLARDRHVVVLRQHHLVTDAASHEILWRRLSELYDRRPGSTTLPSREYAEREQVYLESRESARDARFWRERLAAAPAAAPLYGRDLRARGGLVRRVTVPLGAERTSLLRARIEQRPLATPMRELTRHLAYATAFFAYLARVTGQRGVAVGCPLANRRSRRLKQVVGLVMEQSPMFAELSPDDSFVSLHARLKDELSAVLTHARHCTSNPSQRRIYDAVLNLHTVRWSDIAGTRVRASIAPALAFADRWPEQAPDGGEALSLTIWEEDDTDVLAFDLNRDVFDETLARRAPVHFLRMLDALIADPSARPAEVDLLADDERAICAAPIAPAPALPTVVETVRAQVERTPERVAVRTASGEWSYRALWARAAGIARALSDAGLCRGDCVAVALDRSEHLPAALLGIMAAGGAYVPIDPEHPTERIARILEDARPRFIVTEPSVTLERCGLPRIDVTRTPDAEAKLAPLDGDDLAYVLFTSGSSGRPKGVEVLHRGLSAFLASFAHTPGMDAGDRVLAIATPGFDIHTLELLLPLCVGASTFVAEAHAGGDGARLRALIEHEGITIVQATPPSWRLLLDAGWPGDGALKALIGGEALAPDLAEALLPRVGSLWNVYGPTEATVWATTQRIVRAEHPASIGRPIETATVRVLDDNGVPVPIGVEGEIWIGGAGLARGYRGREDLTRASFVRDRDGDLLYRTGDRGRWRADGALECLGRSDGQVKVRGLRVELGEIEAALREHPGVSDAVVILVGQGADARLVAHVARERGAELDLEELRKHAASRLPSYMVPARTSVHDALPLGPTGKIDRRALAALGVVAAPSTERTGPRNDLEAALAAIWAETLDLPRVGIDEDFFDLGGHSLLAARLVDRIRHDLEVELPMSALFTKRTVAALAEQLDRCDGEGPPACIALQREGEEDPLFCVCGVQIYSALATRLGRRHPVYGVFLPVEEEVVRQARGGRVHELHIESMARDYIELIRGRRPHGPYLLAGLSFGGVLALEIAQQLRAAGEEVRLVALFDSILPHALRREPVPWLVARARMLVSAPREQARRILGVSRHEGDALTAAVREQAYVSAMRRYRSRPYPGDVVLFRASDSSFGAGVKPRRDGGFARFVPRLRVLDVPGSHTGVLAPPHVDALASALAPLLERAR